MGKKIEIIKNTDQAITHFAKQGWGHETIVITQEHLNALMQGKCIGWNDGEYTHLIKVEK